MALPLFSTTSFKDNSGLGGFLAGMGDSFALANADRDLYDRDIRTRAGEIGLEYAEAENPVKMAELANRMATAGLDAEDHANGRQRELRDAEHSTKIQEAIAKKSEAEIRHIDSQARGMLTMNSMFDENDDKNPDLSTMTTKWEQAREVANRIGIKSFPPTYSPEALQRLRMGAKAAMATLPHLQKRDLMSMEQGYKTSAATTEHDRNMELQRLRNQGMVDAAHARPNTDPQSRLEGAGKIPEKLYGEIMETPGPVSIDKLRQYIGLSASKDNAYKTTFEKQEAIYRTLYQQNPQAKEEAAKKFGMDPKTGYVEVAKAAAEKEAQRFILKEELPKFEGKTFQLEDGKLVKVVQGELVPAKDSMGGAKEAPAAPAKAPAATTTPPKTPTTPMAPAAPPSEDPGAPAETGAAFGQYPGSGKDKPGQTTPKENPTGLPSVSTNEDFRKLPPGAAFWDAKNKVMRRKPE